MSKPEPYKLTINVSLKSKAKLFKFFPMKSIISGQYFDIAVRLQNIGNETFPGADFHFEIVWPSQQMVKHRFPIPKLEVNEIYDSPKFKTEALCDGFGLIFLRGRRSPIVKDGQGNLREIQFYEGKRTEDLMNIRVSVASINSKRSEEIYEFWAMTISAISLLIIAIEKIFSFFD